MDLTRRQILTAAAAGATLTVAACGCGTSPAAGAAKAPVAAGPVDIGTIGDYPMDGVYDRFADSHDFFVVREGNRLFALSAICTHRECPLKLIHGGIKCRCHGSTFTSTGHVTHGPAKRDLPRLGIERASGGRLIVHSERPPISPSDSSNRQFFLDL